MSKLDKHILKGMLLFAVLDFCVTKMSPIHIDKRYM